MKIQVDAIYPRTPDYILRDINTLRVDLPNSKLIYHIHKGKVYARKPLTQEETDEIIDKIKENLSI